MNRKFLVFDETNRAWVARCGFADNSLEAKAFDSPTACYDECLQRSEMVGHFIVVVLFYNRQCLNRLTG